MIGPRILLLAALAALVAGCGGGSTQAGSTSQRPAPTVTVTVTETPGTTPTPASTAASSEPASHEPRFGDHQTTDLGPITVFALKFPVAPQDDMANRIATKGMQFAVADIKVCSNGTKTSDGYMFSAEDFQVVDTEDRSYTFWNVQIGARSPNLTDSLTDTMRAGSCTRGWLTFQLPPKAKVRSVEFAPYEGTALSWQR
jgi:hypothetical protein